MLVWSGIIIVLDWFLQNYFRSRGLGVANSGISFGLGGGWGWYLTGMGVFVLIVYTIVNFFKNNRVNNFLLCLAVGGVGNLVPRFVFGSVWDYIPFYPLNLWINLSDILITLSVLSYILRTYGTKDSI